MKTGTVKFFNAAKGFGFVVTDGGDQEVFIPGAVVKAAGVANLKPGQRMSFEDGPDKKGLKVTAFTLLADSIPVQKDQPQQGKAPAQKDSMGSAAATGHGHKKLTVYLDPDSDEAHDVLDQLEADGHAPRVVDYMATPPTAAELKSLSLLLRDSNQSLARKYDPLFLELRLDDRFISDGEYWGAIHEHPALINGPIVVNGSSASVCRSAAAARVFVDGLSAPAAQPLAKPKGLSERLLGLMAASAPAPIAVPPPDCSPVLDDAPVQAVKPVRLLPRTPRDKSPDSDKPVKAKPATAKSTKTTKTIKSKATKKS